MIPKYYEFLNSVKILSGDKALENIPYELKQFNASKPIILSDAMLQKIGTVDIVIKAIGDQLDTSTVFVDIPPDSSYKVVNAIREVYTQNNCDSIIAIGGGSVIDTAKGVRMLISQQAEDIKQLEGSEILKKGIKAPFVVVPTTSGTGSEATLVAVISNPDEGTKKEFVSYELLPDAAVLDVRMTETLPPKITASTGMDALCHALEAYTCLQKNPVRDAYAISAMRLIVEYLEKAVDKPKDKKARIAMANASLLAGIAFQTHGGACSRHRACGGGVSHIPHGNAMAILLPMLWNLICPNAKSFTAMFCCICSGPKFTLPRPPKKGAGCAWKRYAKCSIGLTKMRFAHEVEG